MKNSRVFSLAESSTAEYRIWQAMKNRCYNIKSNFYADYGGRGITICTDWLTDFAIFLIDMGRRPTTLHTLERIHNDGNYYPDNCKWATKQEQSRNRRNTIYVTYNGTTRKLIDICTELNFPPVIAQQRKRRGWKDEELFTVRFKRRLENEAYFRVP